VRATTLEGRRHLYDQARAVIARDYRQALTLPGVARAVASSPRALQRAYAQFGETSFREDLRAARMRAAAELLAGQASIEIRDVARLVGFTAPGHFAAAFRCHFGVAPAEFRRRAGQ
jgi:AraC family transcriptional regulator, regulatory protein of adaptative response / methylphosphotriester-DNA alkyltransferase methyltransferase